MLFCFGLFGLLLYNTVVANAVCSYTYAQKDEIKANSVVYENQGYKQCEYVIRAPRDSYIELNFTRIFGFTGPQNSTSPMSTGDAVSTTTSTGSGTACGAPPQVVIWEQIQPGGTEATSDILCTKVTDSNYQGPKVFQSKSNFLKLTYKWMSEEHSGFIVHFDFHQKIDNCGFYCDDSTCLIDSSLVCNQVYNCPDKSDEQNCSHPAPSLGTTESSSDSGKIIVIVIVVVLMPGLVTLICVVSPCRLARRMWRRRRHSSDRGQEDHSQLRPQSQGSEVYVPSKPGHLEQEVALLRERQIQSQSARTALQMGYPPQIPISLDGEETYAESQKQLASHRHEHSECVRAPPNKTVFDRESPPPYFFSHSSNSLDRLNNPPSRLVRDSCPVMLRCYSMSVSNNNHHNLHSKSHARTPSSTSPGGSQSGSAASTRHSLGPPPEYPGGLSMLNTSTDVYSSPSGSSV